MNALAADSKQILIVDDDPQTREGLALVLEAAGYTVRSAANGLEALQDVRRCRPDLILLDLVMPTMDGWTFRMQQLRDPALADIPVVVLANGGGRAAGRAAELGIAKCFAKPKAGHAVLDLIGELFDILEQDNGGAGFQGGDCALSSSHNTASAGAPSAR